MDHRPLSRAARSLMFATLAAVMAATSFAPPAGAAPRSPALAGDPARVTGAAAPAAVAATTAAAAQRAGPTLQVLLINGDRATVGRAAGLRGAAPFGAVTVLPVARGGLAGTVIALGLGGRRYEIPAAALPYLGHGLDRSLFDLGALLAHERGGRLPVRVSYHGHLPALPGIRITRSGAGTAAGYLTDASARTFGAALDRQYVADHARASYGADGLFAGGTAISLPGTAPATPAPAPAARAGTARPAAPRHKLTVTATNLAGQPDTGDFLFVISVDNTRLSYPPGGLAKVFKNGVATFRVPSGHYYLVAEFGGTKMRLPTRFVVLPQVGVTGNRTVAIKETAAKKVTMVTPRPAAVIDTAIWLLRTGRSGPPIVFELFDEGPAWLSPAAARPAAGRLRVAVNQHLESPPGPGVPYEYTLSYTDAPGTIPVQHYVVSGKDLATVHERFYQPVTSSGGWVFSGSFPGTDPNVDREWFGFIEPAGPTLAFPGRLTEYAGGAGTAHVEWKGQYEPNSDPFQGGDSRQLRPGEQLTENWGALPLHTAATVLHTSEPNMFSTTEPSAVRAGNELRVELDPFDDNQPGHHVGMAAWTGTSDTGSYQIDQNGTKIAGGDALTHTSPYGEFYATAALGSGPATIRVSLALTRTDANYPLSTATATTWTWRSAPVTGAKLPKGWSCAPLTRDRDCAAEPMMTLRYAVAGLGFDGAVRPGHQVVRLSVGHLQAAAGPRITKASVSVSFDGGKTWHPARVTGHDGSYAAGFTAPAGVKVTLRTSAADAAGGSVTERITSAYRISG